jgi:YegS/Rv2252/BmrU family lipid kinase
MKRLVIVNPASGNGRTGRTWPTTERLLREHLYTFDAAFTQAAEDATLLTHRAISHDGYDHIIAIGGDGTLSEVVNGFFVGDRAVNEQAMVSFIPSGTGSDIARTLEIPTNKEQAIKRIARLCASEQHAEVINTSASTAAATRVAQTRMVDVGKLTLTDKNDQPFQMYFVNVMSCGMSGGIVRRINRARLLKKFGGKIAFYLLSLAGILEYTNTPVRMSITAPDDNTMTRETSIRAIAVANGRYFGAGMMIAPAARPDDGTFDVVTLGNLSSWTVLRKLGWLYDGRHLQLTDVFWERGTRITLAPVRPEDRVLLDVDGEGIGRLPATIEVMPHALRFL